MPLIASTYTFLGTSLSGSALPLGTEKERVWTPPAARAWLLVGVAPLFLQAQSLLTGAGGGNCVLCEHWPPQRQHHCPLAVAAVQLPSRVRLCDPTDGSTPGFLVLHHLLGLPKFVSIELVTLSNRLILNLRENILLNSWLYYLGKVILKTPLSSNLDTSCQCPDEFYIFDN